MKADRKQPKHEIGRIYYTETGMQVELLAVTTTGKLVVAELKEFDSYHGDGDYSRQTVRGETFFTEEVFETAPRHLYDVEIQRLKDEETRLDALLAEKRGEVLATERDLVQRLAKLKKFKGLERIEDFIEGRITHVVTKEYDDWKIQLLSEFEADDDGWSRKPCGLRLISLFGKSGGDLAWKVNDYKDGSGSWKEMIPCASEDEAKTRRDEWIVAEIKEQFGAFKPSSPHWFITYVTTAVKYGVSLSEEIMDAYRKCLSEQIDAHKAKTQGEIEKAYEKLAELDARKASI